MTGKQQERERSRRNSDKEAAGTRKNQEEKREELGSVRNETAPETLKNLGNKEQRLNRNKEAAGERTV